MAGHNGYVLNWQLSLSAPLMYPGKLLRVGEGRTDTRVVLLTEAQGPGPIPSGNGNTWSDSLWGLLSLFFSLRIFKRQTLRAGL